MTMTTLVARPDEDVRHDVQDELEWDAQVSDSPIGVGVKQGVVTLTGEVSNYMVKAAAIAAAHRVRGVKAVADEITIHLPAFAERTDADIAQAIYSALHWHTLVPAERIQITVAQGVVTLKGVVERGFQLREVEQAVRAIAGVRAIANLLAVAPHAQIAHIKQQVKQALLRSAEVEVTGIIVAVQDATVTLHGTVHSFAEKRAAERAAWAAPGVSAVDNQLEVNTY
jgi:osmotically-inducible protein OsmY